MPYFSAFQGEGEHLRGQFEGKENTGGVLWREKRNTGGALLGKWEHLRGTLEGDMYLFRAVRGMAGVQIEDGGYPVGGYGWITPSG